MASKRQLEANRANAKYSTGPKTGKGKARARKNALTHGLTAAKEIVVAGERPEQFEAFREKLFASFNTTLKIELVKLLAGLLWRLRRVPVLEVALLHDLMPRRLGDLLKQLTNEELAMVEAVFSKALNMQAEPQRSDLARDIDGGKVGTEKPRSVETLAIFSRYHSNLLNDVFKTLRLLHACNASSSAHRG